jgi:aminopeptidase S
VTGIAGRAPSALKVGVDIQHPYKGDLVVDLVAPDGSVYNLHNRAGGSGDNIVGTFTVNAASENANGTWTLRVRDYAKDDLGKVQKFSLQF